MHLCFMFSCNFVTIKFRNQPLLNKYFFNWIAIKKKQLIENNRNKYFEFFDCVVVCSSVVYIVLIDGNVR